MKKHKRIGAALLSLLIGFVLLCMPASAAEQRVFDQAGLLEAGEISELESTISDMRQKWKLDFVVVTTDDAQGKTAQAYADDYYDDNGFGEGADKSGALFLIDMDNREAYISTTGSAIQLYTDARIERMLDAVFEYLPDGDYYQSAAAFLQAADRYAGQGVPVAGDANDPDYEGGAPAGDQEPEGLTVSYILVAVFLSLLAGGAVFLVVFFRYNRKGKTVPYPFRQQSGMQMLRSEDVYLGTTTKQRHIDTSNHSGGHGGGGGSSVHTSSSGTSHGGGGRSF